MGDALIVTSQCLALLATLPPAGRSRVMAALRAVLDVTDYAPSVLAREDEPGRRTGGEP